MSELVVAINREELKAQGIDQSGLQVAQLWNTQNYALLPRAFADNKLDSGVALGGIFAQVLPYFVIQREDGRILTYQRAGKEEGLLGQWSIGVGGHISHDDFLAACDLVKNVLPACKQPSLADVVLIGAERELEEELGISITLKAPEENPLHLFSHVINYDATVVDQVHLAVVHHLTLTEGEVLGLELDPSEFNNWCWSSVEALQAGIDDYMASGKPFENWSKLIINDFIGEGSYA